MRHTEDGDSRIELRQIGLDRSAKEADLRFVHAYGREGTSLSGVEARA